MKVVNLLADIDSRSANKGVVDKNSMVRSCSLELQEIDRKKDFTESIPILILRF